MGIHLCVYRIREGKEVGEAPGSAWDSMRYSGDRDFAQQILVNAAVSYEQIFQGGMYFRPKDIAAWKAWSDAHEYNPGRWGALADLLASDPELWVYVSV